MLRILCPFYNKLVSGSEVEAPANLPADDPVGRLAVRGSGLHFVTVRWLAIHAPTLATDLFIGTNTAMQFM